MDVTNDDHAKCLAKEFLIPVGLHGFADDPRVGRNAYRELQRRVGRSSGKKNEYEKLEIAIENVQAQGLLGRL